MATLDIEGRLPRSASWEVEGRLVEASNVVLRMRDGAAEDGARAVYKPSAGERPLSDFPFGTLARREIATYLVASAGGWQCIPETVWYSGEFGDGSLQRWVGPLDGGVQDVVGLLPAGHVTDAHAPISVFETDDGPAVLVHAHDDELRAVAALDVVTANADRKGSHLIRGEEALYAIDHGLTFHREEKLRTVLWGWAGEALGPDVEAKLRSLVKHRETLAVSLLEHLTEPEIESFHRRTDALLRAGTFPEPPDDRYGLPWPPL